MSALRVTGAGALAAALLTIALAPAEAERGTPSCFGQDAEFILDGSENVFRGTKGNDVIVGSEERDEIRGLGGKDRICGRDSDDAIDGGGGDDRLDGDFGTDILRGRRGNDLMIGFGGKGSQEDFCHGGKPFRDTEANHDTAVGCVSSTSAFIEGQPGR
jgi:Ca2+-binding RTX toxin-like protein